MSAFWKACQATAGVVITLMAMYIGYGLLPDVNDLQRHTNKPVAEMTLQQRASHMIRYLDDKGAGRGLCTGTAIGPHAILTAEHCNDGTGSDKSTQIEIDYSTHKYRIMHSIVDDRDHEIYLIDGPPLKNIVAVNLGDLHTGQHIQYYGFGQGVYPSTLRQGRVRATDDPSDVDATAKLYLFDFPAIHGDSGSAIYDDSGNIVGLVSYVLPWYGRKVMGAFALNFDSAQFCVASFYDPASDIPDEAMKEEIDNLLPAPFKF
jgi:hypothetical protein